MSLRRALQRPCAAVTPLLLAMITAAALAPLSAKGQLAEDQLSTVEPGALPTSWLPAGPRCMEVQPWQVHEYNASFFILRQSGCSDYEKPFVYLIFGKERALLYDTGSRNGEIVPAIARTVHAYLERNQLSGITLDVVHSHSHEDHVWGDKDLAAWKDPAVTVRLIPATVDATKDFYGIHRWPDETGSVDLGDRVLDAIPIPGHDLVGLALYDRRTGVLLTSDSVYPGRLYIEDLAAYTASNERLLHFTEGKPVSHLLGNHIEEKRTAFEDYPVGTIYQPEEHVLELPRGVLFEIRDGLEQMHGKPRRLYFADFTLWPTDAASTPTPAQRAAARRYHDDQVRRKWDQRQP